MSGGEYKYLAPKLGKEVSFSAPRKKKGEPVDKFNFRESSYTTIKRHTVKGVRKTKNKKQTAHKQIVETKDPLTNVLIEGYKPCSQTHIDNRKYIQFLKKDGSKSEYHACDPKTGVFKTIPEILRTNEN